MRQFDERGAELDELLVRSRDPVRQTDHLVDLRAPPGKPGGPRLQLALQADSLRLDSERAGIAVGERAFDLLERGRGSGREHTDVIQHGAVIEGVLGHLSIIRPPPAEGMGRASYLLSQ
jgi:hypothetical protein